ncbi:MAG TPA: 2OG-Fe(II) oxygenase [Gemmataceae bacterium]|nr:2OG-Fe(II) oxygenase [Gemmataceae bacterium]
MTAKKQKEKERRRARKMADEAWEAVDAGNLDLARKLSLRAVTTQPDNPRLWNDRGRILLLSDNENEADRAFRYAIRLARDFAEPHHHLAAIRARQDRLDDAVALEADALRLDPDNPDYAAQLEAYRTAAELQRQETLSKLPWAGAPAPADALPDDPPETAAVAAAWSERLRAAAQLDWERLGERLTREGYVLLPELLPAADCAELRGLFDDEDRFVKTVVMNDPDFGEGVYRYFRAPIPAAVAGLRRAVYPHVAAVANTWQRLLDEEETYPLEWEAFRDHCRQAGQTKSTPILLRYGPGGFNALHRDLRGRVFFPIQLAVVLSPRADQAPDGFQGGEFLFCDVPEGPKARRREVAAGLGDAVLFCTRDRMVAIGGAYGLQPVKHGMAPLSAGSRTVLGVPFHEYR